MMEDHQVEERPLKASPEEISPEDHLVEEKSPKAFLVICSEKLYRYDLGTKKISLLLTFPFDIGDQDYVVSIKVSDHLHLIDQ